MQAQAASSTTVFIRRNVARPVRSTAAVIDPSEDMYESIVESQRFAKGILLAIGLEAATAVCVFCAWQAWHMIR